MRAAGPSHLQAADHGLQGEHAGIHIGDANQYHILCEGPIADERDTSLAVLAVVVGYGSRGLDVINASWHDMPGALDMNSARPVHPRRRQ